MFMAKMAIILGSGSMVILFSISFVEIFMFISNKI